MDFIKKHKLTAFMIVVYIVVVGFGYFLYNMFIGSSGMPVYGDRLYGIESVPITDQQYENILDELYKENYVVSVMDPYLSGRILKVIITVADTAEVGASKALATKVSSQLTTEQNNFYDIEVFVTKEYHCTILASGLTDEENNFTSDITIKFEDDLSKNDNALSYGLSKSNTTDYNAVQTITINEDGEYIIYGYTKDKLGESKCSIKVVRKANENGIEKSPVSSASSRNFPIIGYKKYGTEKFVWTKDR